MRKKTHPSPEAPPTGSDDRLAALEAEIARIRADTEKPKFQGQDALPAPGPLSGWQLAVQQRQQAALERRRAAADAQAEAARAQAVRDAPAQAKRDAELRLIDAELEGVHREYHLRVRRLTEDRARLAQAPLEKITRRELATERGAS